MPAKRIIILDRPGGGRVRYALWADVPTARQSFYAQIGKVSEWQGASAGDNAALASGAVTELVDTVSIDGTNLQVQAHLEIRWTEFQAQINASNPWNRYGTFWDGTTWTVGGVT